MLFCVFGVQHVFSQDSESSQKQTVTSSIDETQIQLTDSSTVTDNANFSSGSGGLWVFVRMIIVLLIVIAAIYFVFRFLRKKTMPEETSSEPDPFLRRVSSISLGQGKSVQIVSLIDKAYILGVTDSSINLISEVTNEELIQDMNVYADKNAGIKKPRTFDELLEIFMPKKKSRVSNVYDDGGASRIIDSLKNKHLSEEEESSEES